MSTRCTECNGTGPTAPDVAHEPYCELEYREYADAEDTEGCAPHPCGCLYAPHPESEGLRVCVRRCSAAGHNDHRGITKPERPYQ